MFTGKKYEFTIPTILTYKDLFSLSIIYQWFMKKVLCIIIFNNILHVIQAINLFFKKNFLVMLLNYLECLLKKNQHNFSQKGFIYVFQLHVYGG